MMEFMQAGGLGIWVVLLFGLITIGNAGVFAFRPLERKIGIIRSLSVATMFTILAAVSANLSAVGFHIYERPELNQAPNLHLLVMLGIGESLTPAILGFSILGVVWLMIGVGHRRLGEAVG